jgi:hypothetical protein
VAILDLITSFWIVIVLMFAIALHNTTSQDLLLLFQLPHTLTWLVSFIASATGSRKLIQIFRYIMMAVLVLDTISFVWRFILLIECFDSEEPGCLNTGIKDMLFLLFILALVILDALQIIFTYLLEVEVDRQMSQKTQMFLGGPPDPTSIIVGGGQPSSNGDGGYSSAYSGMRARPLGPVYTPAVPGSRYQAAAAAAGSKGDQQLFY